MKRMFAFGLAIMFGNSACAMDVAVVRKTPVTILSSMKAVDLDTAARVQQAWEFLAQVRGKPATFDDAQEKEALKWITLLLKQNLGNDDTRSLIGYINSCIDCLSIDACDGGSLAAFSSPKFALERRLAPQRRCRWKAIE